MNTASLQGTKSGGKPTLAIVGATGLVGSVVLQVLATSDDLWGDIILVASERSAGRVLTVRNRPHVVQKLTPRVFDDVDIAMFDLPDEVTEHWAPIAAARGAMVVDNSGAYRTNPDVPLVAPHVNPQTVAHAPLGIVANPSSATLTILDCLGTLHRLYRLKKVVITACLAASGQGRRGVDRLHRELRVVSNNLSLGQRPGDIRGAIEDDLGENPSPFSAPLALNVIPWAGPSDVDGFSATEMKLVREIKRILAIEDLVVTATCLRVPVLAGHTVSVHVACDRPVTVKRARQALVEAPGVVVLEGGPQDLPTPVDVVGADPAFIGRIRQNPHMPHTLDFVACGDNLRRGAALNSVRVAELLASEMTGQPLPEQ